MIVAVPDQRASAGNSEAATGTSRSGSLARWAVMVFIASIPSENGVAIAGLGSLSRLLGVTAFALTLLAAFHKDGLRLRAPSLFIVCAAAFGTWLLASYYWSEFPAVTLSYVFTMFQLLVLAWLVHETARSEAEMASLMQAFVMGAYLLIGVTVVRVLGSSEMGFRELGAFNPNGFAIVASLAIPMAWFLQARDGRADGASRRPLALRLLNSLYPVAALVAVVLAASRGGLLVMLTCLLVIPLTLHHLTWWRRLMLAVALAGVTTALALLAPSVFPNVQASVERLTGVTDELAGGTLTGRTTIWSQGLELFERSPVVGSGAGTFADLHRLATGEYRAAHNAFLSVAVGSGATGLLLYVGLIALSLMAVLNSGREVRPYLAVLLAALVVSMLPANTDTDKFMWFALALVGTQAPTSLVASSSRRRAKRQRAA